MSTFFWILRVVRSLPLFTMLSLCRQNRSRRQPRPGPDRLHVSLAHVRPSEPTPQPPRSLVTARSNNLLTEPFPLSAPPTPSTCPLASPKTFLPNSCLPSTRYSQPLVSLTRRLTDPYPHQGPTLTKPLPSPASPLCNTFALPFTKPIPHNVSSILLPSPLHPPLRTIGLSPPASRAETSKSR